MAWRRHRPIVRVPNALVLAGIHLSTAIITVLPVQSLPPTAETFLANEVLIALVALCLGVMHLTGYLGMWGSRVRKLTYLASAVVLAGQAATFLVDDYFLNAAFRCVVCVVALHGYFAYPRVGEGNGG